MSATEQAAALVVILYWPVVYLILGVGLTRGWFDR